MNFWPQSKDYILVAAHRGSSAKYPENTMLAFEKAIEEGADQIETDIRISKDGEIVLIHDATVDRTTNGHGLVRELTLKELKALDAGAIKGAAFKGAQIPTLRELMELVKDHPSITLDLELKEYPIDPRKEDATIREDISYELCDRVLQMIDEYGFADRVIINTFSGQLHEYMNEKYGNKYRQHIYYPITKMSGITRDPFEYAYCCCMFRSFWAPINMAEKEEFEQCAKLGVQPWAGASVKDEATVDMAIERGAPAITCNNPGEVLAILKAKGKRS